MAPTSPLRYLVEWYLPDLTDESVPALVAALEEAAADGGGDSGVTLILTMGVPSDEVVYALFAAPSVEVVTELCARVGYPAQRVTANVDARFRLEAVS